MHTKTHEQFCQEVYQLVGDEYEVISEYINAKINVNLKHNNESCNYYIWNIRPNNFTNKWLQDNLWNLLLTFVTIIVAFTILQSKVDLIAQDHQHIEEKLKRFPSEDYFNLRFQFIEEQLHELKATVDELEKK